MSNLSNASVWNNLIKNNSQFWKNKKIIAKHGPRVLIATSLGGYDHATILESTLAVALTLRGANIDILLCDKFLPACQMTKIAKISPGEISKKGQLRICETCLKDGRDIFQPLKLPIHFYSQLISKKEAEYSRKIAYTVPIDKIPRFKFKGLSVGEHALAGTLRYFATGDLKSEPLGGSVLRRFLDGAMRTIFVIKYLLQKKTYDAVCFHHGIYVPQGIIGEVCRQKGIRIVNWNPAYRKHTFIFSHHNSYHHTMISEPVGDWENIKLTDTLRGKIISYLKSRQTGLYDWIWFHNKLQTKNSNIYTKIGIDKNKPVIGLLTNVTWDARLHYKSVAFPDMFDWITTTINYFSKRPDIQLVIRIHPAEINGLIPSRQPIFPQIKKVFPKLPSNIQLVSADSILSTYAIMEKCNAVIIYNTKTGIELASLGLPIIVAGEAWIRNKGFSLDISSKTEYLKILNKLPLGKKLSKLQKSRALKYAFHFFFRRMIPLPFIESPKKFKFRLNLSSLKKLLPGNYKGLDIICDGILFNRPFIYRAEIYNDPL